MSPREASLALPLALILLSLGCDLWDQDTSPVAPTGTVLTISANPTSIELFGVSEITVVATDGSGVPARSGTEIRLTSDLGILEETLVTTDSRGIAGTRLEGDGRAGTATVRAASGVATATTVTVTIGTAALAAMFEAEIGESLTVAFKDKSTGDPTGWLWDFGDDSTPSYREDPDPVHTYEKAGTYLVTLTVRNPNGRDSISDFIAVPLTEDKPAASFDVTEGDGLTILFRDTSTNDPTAWSWDFGDDRGSSIDQNPSYTYRAASTYTVTLTASNAAGESTVSRFVTVRGRLVADFTFETDGLVVEFTDRSRGEPTSWNWSFGDSSTSTAPSPGHTYASAGTYAVTLEVKRTSSDGTGMDTESVTKLVTVK